MSTLSCFIKGYTTNNSAGSLFWTTFLLIILVRLRLIGWREYWRKGGVGGSETLKAMNDDKATGPNGYSKAFFHTCWDVLK